MSRLLLIRHAQASFHCEDYDQLSTTGLEQARRLGAFWRDSGFSPDVIVTGPRRRHRQTAALAIGIAKWTGRLLEWPEFDEVRLDALLNSAWQPTEDAPAEVREKYAELQRSHTGEGRMRSFQRLVEAVALAWMQGKYPLPDAESWQDFVFRVRRGLLQLRHEVGPGKTVAVFTSAGPIAVVLQQALQCPATVALDLLWQVRNASITELLQSDERITLRQFNAIPHLADPRLITFR